MIGLEGTTYVLLGTVVVLTCCAIARDRRDLAVLLVAGAGLYLFKVLFIYINSAYVIFGGKLASGVSIDIYNIVHRHGILSLYDGSVRNNFTFHAQAFFNFIPFKIFGANTTTVVITNAIMQSLAGFAMYAFTPPRLSRQVRLWLFVLICLCPAAINFSFFGLRDAIIYFGVSLYVAGLLNLALGRRTLGAVVGGIGFLIALSSRPELLPILLVSPGLLGYGAAIRYLNRTFAPRTRALLTTIALVVIAAVGLAATVQVYRFVIANIGLTQLVNPVEILDAQATARFTRTQSGKADYGGGSNFIPPHLFLKTPWYARYAISVAGMVVVPFPWQLTSLARLLSFGDTLFIFVLLYFAFRSKYGFAEPRTAHAFRLTFVLAILVFASVVSNGGNALRMRLATQPFLIAAAALSQQKEKYKV